MDSREKYPFCKCLYPKKIMNPYTKECIVVPCGHCVACRLRKGTLSTLKCKLESLSHKYCMFVTLTYAPEYLPQAEVYTRTYEDGHQLRYLVNTTERLGKHTDLGEIEISDMALDMLYKKFGSSCIPYLAKRDLQLFMKRLRKRIPYEKIRYYAVGEYGPVHFRPHYHLLLWCDDRQTIQDLGKNIFQSWRFGRVDWQLAKGDAASYVAKYLNSNCNIPQVLRLRQTQPFCVHSNRLGESFLRSTKEDVYQTTARDFNQRSVSLDGRYTEFAVWRSFKAWYFPKCRRFDTLTRSERLYSYQTYAIAQSWLGNLKTTDFAKIITDALFDGFNEIKRYETTDKSLNSLLAYYYNLVNFGQYGNCIIEPGCWYKVYQSIYVDLSISKHFLLFCCDNLTHEEQHRKLTLIENYYKECDYENLKNQLDSESYFLEQYDTDLYKYYYVHTFDEEEFKRLKLYKQFETAQLHNSVNYTKHKKLNDLNNIFNYI